MYTDRQAERNANDDLYVKRHDQVGPGTKKEDRGFSQQKFQHKKKGSSKCKIGFFPKCLRNKIAIRSFLLFT